MPFYDGTHEKSKDLERLLKQYMPSVGPTDYEETELLRAANRLMYDWYNNGWNGNNKTGELAFLHEYGCFTRISFEDLALGLGENPIWV